MSFVEEVYRRANSVSGHVHLKKARISPSSKTSPQHAQYSVSILSVITA